MTGKTDVRERQEGGKRSTASGAGAYSEPLEVRGDQIWLMVNGFLRGGQQKKTVGLDDLFEEVQYVP